MKISEIAIKRLFVISIFCWSQVLLGQKGFYQQDIFQQEYFIENKGQFIDESLGVNQPLFVYRKKDFAFAIFKNELKIYAHGQCFEQKWLNTNTSSTIETNGKSKHYFTYGDASLISYGFKEIKIVNIYPNIDLQFRIDSNGPKYDFLVNPSGNIDNIKFKYSSDKISIFRDTCIKINLDSFYVLEHGLKAFDQKDNRINCWYSKDKQNIFSISVVSHNPLQKLKIDPWYTVVSTLNRNVADNTNAFSENIGFDVDYDVNGNVYVYGGDGLYGANQFLYSPYSPLYNNFFKLAKFNSKGALQWTFQGVIPSKFWKSSSKPGAMVVSKENKEIYIADHLDNVLVAPKYLPYGASVIKLNDSGLFANFITSRLNQDKTELNDIVLLPATKDSLIGFGSNYANFTSLFQWNDSGAIKNHQFTFRNFFLIGSNFIVDKKNKIFALSEYRNRKPGAVQDSVFMFKIDTNFDKNAFETFLFRRNNDNSPTAFRWRSDSKKSISSASTASNILAVNSKNVFYYDGHRFYVIDKINGSVEFVDSIVQRGPFSTIGIAVDECGNLYLAGDSLDISVFNYENKTLKFLQKIQLGTKRLGCFSDIKIDTYKKILYATGDSFVATVSLPISCDLDKDSIKAEITKKCKTELNLKILNLDSSAYYRVTWIEKLNGKIIRDTTGKGILTDRLNNAKPNMQYLIRISKNPSTLGITDTLNIVNHQESRDTIIRKMCAEDTFWLDKQFFLRDTLFQRNYKGYFGCDSIIVFKLNFNPFIRDTIALNFCLGDTFYIANIPYYKNGTYSVKFNASNSCDSIVTYKLKFLYQYSQKIATFCEGDSFTIGKKVYKTSGFYTDTFKSIYGCDSLMYSLLAFLPKSIVSQTKNICEGDSAEVANKKYSISGIYHDTLTAFNTCDSIIHTNVNVFPNNDTTLYIELCNQTSILFNNKLRTSPQVFIDTLNNVNGCDSIITVNLTDKKVKAYFDIDSTNQPSFKFTPNVDASFKGFWDFGMGELDTNLTQQFRSYIDEKDTQYYVCLNVFDSTNCADTFCVNLQITKKTFTVYNSFSPGSDGFNDVYKIKATGGKFKYNIRIFNRWGELVFYQEKANIYDQSKFWNGKVQNIGPECPSGSYFVLFEFFDKGDEKPPTTMHGSISLFRN